MKSAIRERLNRDGYAVKVQVTEWHEAEEGKDELKRESNFANCKRSYNSARSLYHLITFK